jgi:alcohol dehydrogenase (NADP+)
MMDTVILGQDKKIVEKDKMMTLGFANGDQMPILGLGTWKSNAGEVYSAVREALRIGYRHIDCAAIYGNETEVGTALADSFKEGLVSRDQLWITSKLWNNAHAPEDVRPALEKTLKDLGLDYLDLYLIHWPVLIKKGVLYQKSGADLLPLDHIPIEKTWKAMEISAAEGLCRHLGVSNFSVAKLKSLLAHAEIRPEVNQIELHPYLQQPAMLEFCRENVIHLTAYAPLGSADRPSRLKVDGEPVLMEEETIREIARTLAATPAQVLISWAIQRKTSVIPKSVNPERLRQNFEAAALTLSEEQMQRIEKLDRHRRYINGEFWAMEGSSYTLENLWDE